MRTGAPTAGSEHWGTQAGFCSCLSLHSFPPQWKSLTQGTGTATGTPHTAPGVGALRGFWLEEDGAAGPLQNAGPSTIWSLTGAKGSKQCSLTWPCSSLPPKGFLYISAHLYEKPHLRQETVDAERGKGPSQSHEPSGHGMSLLVRQGQPQHQVRMATALCKQVWKPQAGMEIACGSAAHPRAAFLPGKGIFGGSHTNPMSSSYCITDSFSPSSLGWMGVKSPWHSPSLPEAQGVLHLLLFPASCMGISSLPLSQPHPRFVGPAGGSFPDLGSAGIFL